MSEHLDKARRALEAASPLAPDFYEDDSLGEQQQNDLTYRSLLRVAEVQAQLAQADALERLAFLKECQLGLRPAGERYKPGPQRQSAPGYA